VWQEGLPLEQQMDRLGACGHEMCRRSPMNLNPRRRSHTPLGHQGQTTPVLKSSPRRPTRDFTFPTPEGGHGSKEPPSSVCAGENKTFGEPGLGGAPLASKRLHE
jgi:hypothetical protein